MSSLFGVDAPPGPFGDLRTFFQSKAGKIHFTSSCVKGLSPVQLVPMEVTRDKMCAKCLSKNWPYALESYRNMVQQVAGYLSTFKEIAAGPPDSDRLEHVGSVTYNSLLFAVAMRWRFALEYGTQNWPGDVYDEVESVFEPIADRVLEGLNAADTSGLRRHSRWAELALCNPVRIARAYGSGLEVGKDAKGIPRSVLEAAGDAIRLPTSNSSYGQVRCDEQYILGVLRDLVDDLYVPGQSVRDLVELTHLRFNGIFEQFSTFESLDQIDLSEPLPLGDFASAQDALSALWRQQAVRQMLEAAELLATLLISSESGSESWVLTSSPTVGAGANLASAAMWNHAVLPLDDKIVVRVPSRAAGSFAALGKLRDTAPHIAPVCETDGDGQELFAQVALVMKATGCSFADAVPTARAVLV